MEEEVEVVEEDNMGSYNKDFQKDRHMVVVFQDSKGHMVPLKEDYHNIHHTIFPAFHTAHSLFLEDLQEVLVEVYMAHTGTVYMAHKELYKGQDQAAESKAVVVYKVPEALEHGEAHNGDHAVSYNKAHNIARYSRDHMV